MSTTIFPTHSCFDDALEYMSELAMGDSPALLEHVLVHAICLGPEEGSDPDSLRPGEPFAHAWVEHGDHAIFAGMLDGERVFLTVDKGEFLSSLRVQEATRYTPEEAQRENLRTKTYGPWEPRYQALTRDKRRQAVNARERAGP